jgi:hypothetical protein
MNASRPGPALRPAVANPVILPASGTRPRRDLEKWHQDDLLDAALEETFPASDPVSVVRVI